VQLTRALTPARPENSIRSRLGDVWQQAPLPDRAVGTYTRGSQNDWSAGAVRGAVDRGTSMYKGSVRAD
jgi:hypothetical protein